MNKRDSIIKAIRKKQITEAAITLFSQSGYDSVSMDRIAEQAGLSKGALYWYWKAKKDIAFDIYYSTRKLYLEIIDSVRAEPIDILSKLDMVKNRISDTLIENPERFRMITNLWADRNRIFSKEDIEQLMGMLVKVHRALKEMLDEGVANGTFNKIDTSFLAHFVFSAIDGINREWFDIGDEFDLKKAYGLMFELVKKYIEII